VADGLRKQYRQHQKARKLADLDAAAEGDNELRRALELYIGLISGT
jgi:hypothetical protein